MSLRESTIECVELSAPSRDKWLRLDERRVANPAAMLLDDDANAEPVAARSSGAASFVDDVRTQQHLRLLAEPPN